MPPLEQNFSTEGYISSSSNNELTIVKQKGNTTTATVNGITTTTATDVPLPNVFDNNSDDSCHVHSLVLSERDLIIQSKSFLFDDVVTVDTPTAAAAGTGTGTYYCNKQKKKQSSRFCNKEPLDLIEIITNLCVSTTSSCTTTTPRRRQATTTTVVSNQAPQQSPLRNKSRKRVVYPIAKYSDKLDSCALVEQRRKSLEKHLFFRPVVQEQQQPTKKLKL